MLMKILKCLFYGTNNSYFLKAWRWKLFTEMQLFSSIQTQENVQLLVNGSLFHWLHSTSELAILWKKSYLHATKPQSKKLSTKSMHGYRPVFSTSCSRWLFQNPLSAASWDLATQTARAEFDCQCRSENCSLAAYLRTQLCWPCQRRVGGFSCTNFISFASLEPRAAHGSSPLKTAESKNSD